MDWKSFIKPISPQKKSLCDDVIRGSFWVRVVPNALDLLGNCVGLYCLRTFYHKVFKTNRVYVTKETYVLVESVRNSDTAEETPRKRGHTLNSSFSHLPLCLNYHKRIYNYHLKEQGCILFARDQNSAKFDWKLCGANFAVVKQSFTLRLVT